MISIIAWRNIWRHKLRSSVLMSSIGLGIWAGVFIFSLSVGMTLQRRANLIETTVSHIQIHLPAFKSQQRLIDSIPDYSALDATLSKNQQISAHCQRVLFMGMVTAPHGGAGVKVLAVNPEAEQKVTNISQKAIEGEWLTSPKKNAIYMGEKLANKLKLKLGNKIVLTFQNARHDVLAGAFKIVGIFKSPSTQYDEAHVYIRKPDLERLLGIDNWPPNEMALMAKKFEDIPELTKKLSGDFPQLKIESWNQVSPELGYEEAVLDQWLYIFLAILLMAMAFGIINTMLMAILERRRELGMLMSVGMNKFKIFSMLILETLIFTLVGGGVGLVLGYLTVSYWGKNGIDFSIFKEGLETYGLQTMVYPNLEFHYYVNIFLMMCAASLLSAIYPAYKALKLNPVEATRNL